MVCPNCGHEIQDGHLICESCGYEIRMVPDFDPESDATIDKTGVDGILETTGGSKVVDDDIEITEELDIELYAASIRHRILMIASIILGALILIGGAIWAVLRMNSLEYQLNNARRLAESGKYEAAINSLENLYVTHSNESQILFLESDCYLKSGKDDMAIDSLMRIAKSRSFAENDICSAYDKIISIYDSAGEYNVINDLLNECEITEITNAYQNYMAMNPMFSDDSGIYDKTVILKISANTSGTIYYTTDGSVPNSTSKRYESPLFLDHGDYVISAVFINQYGVVSDTVVKTYSITSEIPDQPVVNADSNSYEVPVLITAEIPEGCTVYYTTDKSVPTEDSTRYIDPIPMPVGYSNFSFVAINEQGLASDVVVRSYHLAFPNGLSHGNAIQTLKTRLVERGLLNDMSGVSDRAPGRYTYEVISAIPIVGQGDYYTIREFYHDGTGNVTPTDTTYIVEIYQGSTAILGGDAVNGFIAIAF